MSSFFAAPCLVGTEGEISGDWEGRRRLQCCVPSQSRCFAAGLGSVVCVQSWGSEQRRRQHGKVKQQE